MMTDTIVMGKGAKPGEYKSIGFVSEKENGPKHPYVPDCSIPIESFSFLCEEMDIKYFTKDEKNILTWGYNKRIVSKEKMMSDIRRIANFMNSRKRYGHFVYV